MSGTNITRLGSPAYLFDLDVFADRCAWVKQTLGELPLTYSMKANPFLLNGIPETVSHIEVCSPGELEICIRMGIAPERILYSGVNKETWDIEKAVSCGAGILTAESLLQVRLESGAVCRLRKAPGETWRVLLRLTGGNQFGMSAEDIESVLKNRADYPGLDFYGIHYYSGTQKKLRQVKKDLERLAKLLTRLKESCGFMPRLVEYGPGAAADYFEPPYEETEQGGFSEIAEQILAFARDYPVGVELGRFLAAPCGSYLTQVKDSKVNSETNYLICDGGVHQLKYYGQTLAMQVPPLEALRADGTPAEGEKKPYMLCGSLCTTADILVREAELPGLSIGDYLLFRRCGAYSVTEGSLLFLSRTLPRVYVTDRAHGTRLVRDFTESSALNTGR